MPVRARESFGLTTARCFGTASVPLTTFACCFAGAAATRLRLAQHGVRQRLGEQHRAEHDQRDELSYRDEAGDDRRGPPGADVHI